MCQLTKSQKAKTEKGFTYYFFVYEIDFNPSTYKISLLKVDKISMLKNKSQQEGFKNIKQNRNWSRNPKCLQKKS